MSHEGAHDRSSSIGAAGSIAGRLRIEEFFIVDAEVFGACQIETFIPHASYEELYPFQLLGSLVEAGAVNLAIASGLLAEALGLDERWPRIAPATGKSTYQFNVAPHAAYDVSWPHYGQVEIDALIFARRAGRWTLFVLEAKHGQLGSLAKAKLAYASLAIATKQVPRDVRIVPVYLRAWEEPGAMRFAIAECRSIDPTSSFAVASIDVERARVFSMPLHFASSLNR